MKTLKKGQLVTVFQNHITDEDREGVARLISPEMGGGDEEGGYYWNVRFVGRQENRDDAVYQRWVHARHIISPTTVPAAGETKS